jgi:23S rRNA (guanosine2251-2'-O)-methyltransferase
VEHLPIAVVTNLADLLRRAKTATLWSYAADAQGGRPPWELDLADGTLLVLGSEGSGLRPNVRATCDAVVTVPQRGRVGSLNVGVAAGMLLYEAARQRALRASD